MRQGFFRNKGQHAKPLLTLDVELWRNVAASASLKSSIFLRRIVGVLMSVNSKFGHQVRPPLAPAQRTGEIGLRMALGAETTAIHALVTRQALLPLLPGLVIGFGGALALQQLVATLVFDVSPRNPLTIATVCGLLTVVALSAACFPVRRGTRISPVTALRYE